MQIANSKSDTHIVYVVDEVGISEVFVVLKGNLADTQLPMLSLLYYSHSDSFVFKKELEILQKRFPSKFIVSYETGILDGNWMFGQPTVEAIINTNTLPKMCFIISGKSTFIDSAKQLLHFLSVGEIEIIAAPYLS